MSSKKKQSQPSKLAIIDEQSRTPPRSQSTSEKAKYERAVDKENVTQNQAPILVGTKSMPPPPRTPQPVALRPVSTPKVLATPGLSSAQTPGSSRDVNILDGGFLESAPATPLKLSYASTPAQRSVCLAITGESSRARESAKLMTAWREAPTEDKQAPPVAAIEPISAERTESTAGVLTDDCSDSEIEAPLSRDTPNRLGRKATRAQPKGVAVLDNLSRGAANFAANARAELVQLVKENNHFGKAVTAGASSKALYGKDVAAKHGLLREPSVDEIRAEAEYSVALGLHDLLFVSDYVAPACAKLGCSMDYVTDLLRVCRVLDKPAEGDADIWRFPNAVVEIIKTSAHFLEMTDQGTWRLISNAPHYHLLKAHKLHQGGIHEYRLVHQNETPSLLRHLRRLSQQALFCVFRIGRAQNVRAFGTLLDLLDQKYHPLVKAFWKNLEGKSYAFIDAAGRRHLVTIPRFDGAATNY